MNRTSPSTRVADARRGRQRSQPIDARIRRAALNTSDGFPVSVRMGLRPSEHFDDSPFSFIELGAVLNSYSGLAFASFCAGALAWAGMTAAYEGFISGASTTTVAVIGTILAVIAVLFTIGAKERAEMSLLDIADPDFDGDADVLSPAEDPLDRSGRASKSVRRHTGRDTDSRSQAQDEDED